ncbi:GDYXXLXY domain-containing protein [Rummeliibacillus sp. G93]|uniref:GDYXXLXY domain-containing protein n=1 Tax=Rummeliibacillus sp. G93 TaxID=2939494 RepID=UPI00201C5FEE|nr:GDYXXLXY domain-containing protein [Rummeliibacillus sp. G93]UQW97243.1 GDYXXLXY domain-containing protein [Rummeliibacillus sp. G93]
MLKSNWKKLIAFSLPILILIGMSIPPFLTITTGNTIKLETRPVDPTDLFRGDYVRVNYKAEEVNISKLDKELKDYFRVNNSSFYDKPVVVYSVLEKNENGMDIVKKVVKDQPEEGIYLKGEINYFPLNSSNGPDNQVVEINYQLDKFFVPENTGKDLENAISQPANKTSAIATIKVRKGHAILDKVEIQSTK